MASEVVTGDGVDGVSMGARAESSEIVDGVIQSGERDGGDGGRRRRRRWEIGSSASGLGLGRKGRRCGAGDGRCFGGAGAGAALWQRWFLPPGRVELEDARGGDVVAGTCQVQVPSWRFITG